MAVHVRICNCTWYVSQWLFVTVGVAICNYTVPGTLYIVSLWLYVTGTVLAWSHYGCKLLYLALSSLTVAVCYCTGMVSLWLYGSVPDMVSLWLYVTVLAWSHCGCM